MPTEVKTASLLWWLADFFLYSASIISVAFLIIARYHYLVDIIFAYFVSTRTFYMYHVVCNHESLHYPTQGNFFTKFWWWPLFVFFEVDNPGRIAAVNRFHNQINVLKSLFAKKTAKEIKTESSVEQRDVAMKSRKSEC